MPRTPRLDAFGLDVRSPTSHAVAAELARLRAECRRLQRRNTRQDISTPTEAEKVQRALGARRERRRIIQWLQNMGRVSHPASSIADAIQRRQQWGSFGSAADERQWEREAREEPSRCSRTDRDLPW